MDRYYPFLAAILNFRSKLTSDKVGMFTSEKHVPDTVGVAAGILFLRAICQKLYFRFVVRHIEFVSNVWQQYVAVPVSANYCLL